MIPRSLSKLFAGFGKEELAMSTEAQIPRRMAELTNCIQSAHGIHMESSRNVGVRDTARLAHDPSD
jgi:hypothetical protein